jgi:hypothetical protein
MQFRNLTPFDALSYTGYDTQDREYHVVAMAVGYRLQRAHPSAAPQDPQHDVFEAIVQDQQPARLCLADEHWGDPTSSSLRRESDLVPYKPRCDVTVVGSAYSAKPRREWDVNLSLRQGRKKLIDKTLHVTGPRHFERSNAVLTWVQRNVSATSVYSATTPEEATEVPLRYELAYGGSCQVVHPKRGQPGKPEHLVNEVCYRNPAGAGWMVKGYLDALARTEQGLPKSLPAPQISASRPIESLTQTYQRGAKTAPQMALVRYPEQTVGFGPLCKAWAPRLQLAGTYDDDWLEQRHPYLPKDFDFGYWNGAPQDQQIAFPDLMQGVSITARGLLPGGGDMAVRLPSHRALVLMRLDDGLVLPNPMHIDLIEVDTSDLNVAPTVRLIFRVATLKSAGVRVLEARVETDPKSPLLKLQPSNDYQRPRPQDLLEANHG